MKKNKIGLIIVCIAVMLSLGLTVTAVYDSAEDPLISLSYLRDIFRKELTAELDDKFEKLKTELYEEYRKSNTETEVVEEIPVRNEVPEQPEQPEETMINPSETDSQSIEPISISYEIVELKLGDALYAVSPCELILRSGTAISVAPDATQGIADLTDSKELYNGLSFTKNHLCLIPRGDGRGIKATSESVYIMIRGEYTIVQN